MKAYSIKVEAKKTEKAWYLNDRIKIVMLFLILFVFKSVYNFLLLQ